MFPLFRPCLMTGILYSTVTPINPYMLCGLDYDMDNFRWVALNFLASILVLLHWQKNENSTVWKHNRFWCSIILMSDSGKIRHFQTMNFQIFSSALFKRACMHNGKKIQISSQSKSVKLTTGKIFHYRKTRTQHWHVDIWINIIIPSDQIWIYIFLHVAESDKILSIQY